MSFFKKLFGGSNESTTQETNPNGIRFGRYTDKGKTTKQLDFWKESTDSFKNKKFYESFKSFLNYVRDEKLDNLTITEISGTELEFEFLQGSKIIKGKANNKEFVAQSAVVKMAKPNTAVMRKLMQMNYSLKYSKFSLNEDIVYMKFSSNAIDAGSFKLYDALKELARNADKQDDLLVSEFSALEEIDTHKTIEFSTEIKDIKYKYLLKWINETFTEIEKHDAEKFSGGISFMLLGLLQKIDYLLVPEGSLTDKLEKMHSKYFRKSEDSTLVKNNDLIASFKEILGLQKGEILKGFYQVKSTFPYVNPTTRKVLMDKIFEEKKKTKWYLDNKHLVIEAKMYEYISSYCFFNYGMDTPDRQVLDLMLHLQNQDYFSEMGFSSDMLKDSKPNEKAIKGRLNQIVKEAKVNYPKLTINSNNLKYNDIVSCVDSLMIEMDKMDYSK